MFDLKDSTAERIVALDGIRGLAILLVMFTHYYDALQFSNPVMIALVASSWVGVDIFFVLSGFLITGILLTSKQINNQSKYFKNFYVRRILRIFPIYYLFLLIVFLISWAGKNQWLNIPSDLWYFWVYLQDFLMYDWRTNKLLGGDLSHTWSLAVEEQFYLLWPFVVYYFSESKLAKICIAIILISPLIRWIWALQSDQFVFVFMNIFFRLDSLSIGALLAIGVRNRAWLVKYSSILWSIATLSIVFLLIELFYYGYLSRYRFGYPLLYSSIAFISAWLIWINLKKNSSKVMRITFESKLLTTFGKYSYSLYLIHIPLLTLYRNSIGLGANIYFWAFPLFVIFCLLISKFLWKFIESPFLRLKKGIPI